jgi:hypothetical protein
MAKGNEELKQASELEKARGETPSQQEIRSYHEGEFQEKDPVTGEPRDNKGGTWQEQDEIAGNIIGTETTAADLESAQQAEIERSSATSAEQPARKTARKSARKGR